MIRQRARSGVDLRRWVVAGVLCLTAAAGMAHAGEIYKSIDANGNVVYSDHIDSTVAQSVVQLQDPRFPPHELHFCWTNCFTLLLDEGAYRRTDGTDETWTVETFTAKGVVLHRHDAPVDWNGYSKDVVYAGQVSNDRLVGVTVDGKAVSGVDASWGSALNTLPGSNAERDAKPPANNLNAASDAVNSTAAPPPVLDEQQPELPQDGFLWTPGYWYRRNQTFVWIPGAWMRPPQFGYLWTPAYWDRAGSVFVFHPGRWGSTVGYYGGINYGYGYSGNGYAGGHWIGNSFAYNGAVNRVSSTVAHRTYTESLQNVATRGVASSNSPVRTGEAPATSQHTPQPRAVNPATIAVERTAERAPTQVTRPAAVAKTPSAAPARISHATSAPATPAK